MRRAPRRAATRSHFGGPLHDALTAAPELAVLSALVALAEIAGHALYAAYPELADPERPAWLHTPAAVPHATRILRDAARLCRAIDRYRDAVISPPTTATPAPPGDEDLPF